MVRRRSLEAVEGRARVIYHHSRAVTASEETALKSLLEGAAPDGLFVDGPLVLTDLGLRALPPRLRVAGSLTIEDCHALEALPEGLEVGGDLVVTGCDALRFLPSKLRVRTLLRLSYLLALEALPGDVDAPTVVLIRLPQVREVPAWTVHGDVRVHEECEALGEGFTVYGALDLSASSLRKLPADLRVTGRLHLPPALRPPPARPAEAPPPVSAHRPRPPPPRLHLPLRHRLYSNSPPEGHEIPFEILVMGDFKGGLDDRALRERRPVNAVKGSLEVVMTALRPELTLTVPDLLGEIPGGLGERMCDAVVRAVARFQPGDAPEQIGRDTLDAWVAEIDARLSAQVDAIRGHPRFEALEASWRSLERLLDHVDAKNHMAVEVLNVTKAELADDLADAPSLNRSALNGPLRIHGGPQLYGGSAIALVVGDYVFDEGDLTLLRRLAALSALAKAPFVASASPSMLGLDAWARPPSPETLLKKPGYASWRAFRERDEARYVGLCAARVMLRRPRRDPAAAYSFTYRGDVAGRPDPPLPGSAAFALAARIASSFARDRCAFHFVGFNDGWIDDALERGLTPNAARELSRQGFIAAAHRPDAGACFEQVCSAWELRTEVAEDPGVPPGPREVAPASRFGESEQGKVRRARASRHVSVELGYTLLVTRVMHYLRVMAMSSRWSGAKTAAEVERDLSIWIGQYIAQFDDPAPGVLARRPFYTATVKVAAVEGEMDVFQIDVTVQPHLRYMGARTDLRLTDRVYLP